MCNHTDMPSWEPLFAGRLANEPGHDMARPSESNDRHQRRYPPKGPSNCRTPGTLEEPVFHYLGHKTKKATQQKLAKWLYVLARQ